MQPELSKLSWLTAPNAAITRSMILFWKFLKIGNPKP
jgi:hypothetical protein